MNNLTIIIYLIEVLDNLRTFAGLMTGLSAVVLLVVGFVCLVTADADPNSHYDRMGVALNKLASNGALKALTIFVACVILNVITPSRETMYLMAGSEIGETVVTSPEARAIMNDIHEVIRGQLQ